MRQCSIQCDNVSSNSRTNYPMQECFIQRENVLINAKFVLFNVKSVIQCNKFPIQRNKRDIRQEKQVEKNFHNKKK